jgi:tRNA modification GTPase
VLEVPLDLGGYPVLVFDTAGLREAGSAAEAEGVRRARRAAENADLVLWLADCRLPAEAVPDVGDRPLWRVATKVDLRDGPVAGMGISVVSGAGLSELIARVGRAAAECMGRGSALVARRRQAEAIETAVAALDQTGEARDEIAADLLRSASEAIGRLGGRVDVEDVLDRLFSEFCIGK